MPIEIGVSITPLYAAVLALLLVGLTFRVVQLRRRHRIGIGDGENRELSKAIRAHGNATETIPIALLLLLLCELSSFGATFLHGLGIALLVGRGLHAFGISRHSGSSFGRFVGMVITLLAIIVMAVVLVIHALT